MLPSLPLRRQLIGGLIFQVPSGAFLVGAQRSGWSTDPRRGKVTTQNDMVRKPFRRAMHHPQKSPVKEAQRKLASVQKGGLVRACKTKLLTEEQVNKVELGTPRNQINQIGSFVHHFRKGQREVPNRFFCPSFSQRATKHQVTKGNTPQSVNGPPRRVLYKGPPGRCVRACFAGHAMQAYQVGGNYAFHELCN